MLGEIIEFFIMKQVTVIVLCFVVQHLGTGRALKK